MADQFARYDFAAHDCGGLALTLCGERVICGPSGALWLESARALIVADLHLEKGSSYAVRGQMLPPYDSRDTIARLECEVERLSPRIVVLLGDTFHDGGAEGRLGPSDLGRLTALAAGRTLVIVCGNHDAHGARNLPGEVTAGLVLAGLDLVHEPKGSPVSAEVAGHLHPCAQLRGYAMGVRRRCFVTDGERIIVPAFGAYAGGLNVRDRAFASLFGRPPLAAVLGAMRVHAIGWNSLGGD